VWICGRFSVTCCATVNSVVLRSQRYAIMSQTTTARVKMRRREDTCIPLSSCWKYSFGAAS
jgi:hypothetical protein